MNNLIFYVKTSNTNIERHVLVMEINDIRIRKILQEGRLRAVVSLTIDSAVAVHDIQLVQGDDRLFVAMPSRRDESGVFRDIIHPINPEARNHLEGHILRAYEEYINAEHQE